jgi:hypothetical protein
MDVVNNVADITIKTVNNTFSNDFFKLISLLLTGIFAGYTLQPVPKWLNKLFDNSNIFKFIIIFTIGITSVYPINKDKISNIFISSVVILVIFSVFRYIDTIYEKKEKDEKNKKNI